MLHGTISRRQLLRGMGVGTLGALLSACQPQTVEKVIEKEVTREVEKEVTREVVRSQTLVIEKVVEKEVTALPADMVTTIRFHSRQVSAEEILYGQRLLEFHRDFPEVKAIHEPVPGTMQEYYPKLLTMSAGGTIGDAYWNTTGTGGHYLFYVRGVSAAVDDMVDATGFDTSVYFPSAVDECSLEGKLLGLPLKAHSGASLNWYNKTAMEDSGVGSPSPDWTFDDLIVNSQKLTADTTGDGKIDQYGFQPGGLAWQAATAMMRAFGSELIDEEGRTCLLASDEGLAMIQWIYNCYYDWQVAGTPVDMETGGGSRQIFVGGKLMQVQSGPWFSRAISLVGDAFTVGLAPMAKGPGGQRPATLVCDSFQVSAQSEHPNEAFNLTSYFCDQKSGVYLGVQGFVSAIGARPDVYADEKITAEPMYGQILDILLATGATRHAHNFRGNEAGAIIQQRTDALWLGEEEPTMGFLEQLNDEVQAVLDKPRD